MKRTILTVAGCAAALFAPLPAASYPIDCAILLCMAGGFPASPHCARAKAEVIRRITPWPIEPPLQIWRCPMGGHAGVSAAPDPSFTSFYRNLQLYDVDYLATARRNSEGDLICRVSRSRVRQGVYNSAGNFTWQSVSVLSLPDWVGWKPKTHEECRTPIGRFRGIGFKHSTMTGEVPQAEVIRY